VARRHSVCRTHHIVWDFDSPALGLGFAQLAPRGGTAGALGPTRHLRRSARAAWAGSRNVVTHDLAVKFTSWVTDGPDGPGAHRCFLIRAYAHALARLRILP
jgi:hypothetical protein